MKFECVWVKLVVMNVNEIIKTEKNLDEVMRVHTHDLIKRGFHLNVLCLESLKDMFWLIN